MKTNRHVLSADEVVIIDFETTGLCAQYERVIEIGAAVVRNRKIVDTFSELCYPGCSIPSFISELTGITNGMLRGKPSPEEIMPKFHSFIGGRPILAHNASFDRQFLHAEMERVGVALENPILCTLMLSRRLIHETPNHKLGTLKKFINFQEKKSHQDHRALDDVEVTAALWVYMQELIETQTQRAEIGFDFIQSLSRMPKAKVQSYLSSIARATTTAS